MRVRCCVSIVCLAIARCAFADDPAKPTDKPGPTAAQQSLGKTDSKGDSKRLVAPDDASLLKSLEKQSAPSQPEANPLERVDQRMRDVQERLAKSDSGDETQTLQKEIVDDLELLIEQIKKSGSNSKQQGKQKRQTSSKQPGQPMKPTEASEPAEGATVRPGNVSDEQKAASARLVRAVWGHLPEKMREEMQQASQDSGLPKYRSLIELYFRAIAEQNESRRRATP